MPRIFLEDITDGRYRLAMIDRAQIAVAEKPGQLGNVYECDHKHRTREDDAQIFYTLAPSIGADGFQETTPLNMWSIAVVDANSTNLFTAVAPLTLADREQLYAQPLSVTCQSTLSSSSKSLFSLVALADSSAWKSGILQRCVDCLVKPEHRGNPAVYAVMDAHYFAIRRVQLELTHEVVNQESIIPSNMRIAIFKIRGLIQKLGLQSSVDTHVFTLTPELPSLESLQHILDQWSGSQIITVEGGYRLKPIDNVLRGLSYMQPWLPLPKHLTILETPF